ncbi:MFS transporter [Teredinibacter purpureus]|uniref:MFS transporter n=1 Tax=Teredinibacter purpureus TaxID=2731756 RepID=UPI0005F80B6B|nr:MFS transporter [Teredinibacter purpureus]
MIHTYSTLPNSVRKFLIAHGASAFSLGVHQVLLAWLSVSLLGLSSSSLGWIQAAGLIPNLLLMLVAGALADKCNVYRILLMAQLGLTVCFLALAALIATNSLTFLTLAIYAIAVGSANAFIQPAREKIVGDLSQHSVQVKITRASIVQFTLQAVGVVVAALSDQAGLVFVIVIQAVVSGLSALQLRSLGHTAMSAAGVSKVAGPVTLFRLQILEGIRAVSSDKRLVQLVGLVGFNGFMHLGLYIVVMPLFARDIYGFNTLEYGFLQLCFVLGMLSAHILIMFKPRIEYPAQGALFSLLYTAIVGYALSYQPTITGLYIMVVFWGWIAGYSASHCRMVLQSLAKPELKGRLMSIYQLMLFGMAPLGALVAGYFSAFYSFSEIFSVLSGASIALFVLFLFTRDLWAVQQQ